MRPQNPIASFLDAQGLVILDGGLATELEARGFDLSDELWSARVLLERPDAIRQLHLDYLAAGADCIIGASYQATVPALLRRGLTEVEAGELLRLSVRLAGEARDAFWRDRRNRTGRLRPLVAASVGPYGAYLADGSEYTGRYDLDEAGLFHFHRRRWQILVGARPDLLACETIPSQLEARALQRLLEETPGVHAWFSFSCCDDRHLCDGTALAAVVAELDDLEGVVAVGINCTAPALIPALIRQARLATDKPIVAYPNSGETYDAVRKRWLPPTSGVDPARASEMWRASGALLIGGCCRVGPRQIQQIRKRLLGSSARSPEEPPYSGTR